MNAPTQTAAADFVAERFAAAMARIDDLRKALDAQQAEIADGEQAGRPVNWADAGSIGYVVKELEALVCFVTGRAA